MYIKAPFMKKANILQSFVRMINKFKKREMQRYKYDTKLKY